VTTLVDSSCFSANKQRAVRIRGLVYSSVIRGEGSDVSERSAVQPAQRYVSLQYYYCSRGYSLNNLEHLRALRNERGLAGLRLA